MYILCTCTCIDTNDIEQQSINQLVISGSSYRPYDPSLVMKDHGSRGEYRRVTLGDLRPPT